MLMIQCTYVCMYVFFSGISALADLIKAGGCKSLVSLNLSYNPIGDLGTCNKIYMNIFRMICTHLLSYPLSIPLPIYIIFD